MADKFREVQAFVDRLVLLEQKAGHKVQYRVMAPLTVPFRDRLYLQTVAKQIAEFIGLKDFAFIVATAKQKANVAGHIDLSTPGREVFIEVDPELLNFPDAVAATLCHEVCHKYLQVNGIEAPTERENEILTDVTTVFLGFGKIMLNGCGTTYVRQEPTIDRTTTITETMTPGYLDRDELALVYRLVCAMRKVPPSDFMQGLNVEATSAVQRCDLWYGHLYSDGFHRIEAMQEIVTGFNGQVVDAQNTMASLNKHVTYVKRSLCDSIDNLFVGGHRTLEAFRQRAVATVQDDEPDPALRFLRTIQGDVEIKKLNDEIGLLSKEAEGKLLHAKVVGLHLSRNSQLFPAPSPAMFNILACPIDGMEFRLPQNSGDIIAICPKCKYRFAYNTSAVSFSEPPAPQRQAWWRRIRTLLKRSKSG